MGRFIRFSAVFFLLSLLFRPAGASPVFDGVEALVSRRLPSLSGRVDFSFMDAADGCCDSFSVSTENGRLKIKATSPSAAASAVNYYLNVFCRMSLSHAGDNLGVIPAELPAVETPVVRRSKFRYRYALNYCTYNYSYSFYDWNDWERELDWMALQGVNLMLAPLGSEIVWLNVLKEYGFTEEEAAAFIAGPGYTAWWLMGNLEGWGGPMSKSMMEGRADMQRRILARMKELGIEPVLQGFWGMVPSTLSGRFADAEIVDQGLWGSFRRPSVLLPESPLFDRMADSWYSELKRQYGDDIRYLGGDLFHEGGDTTGVNVRRTAGLVSRAMQRNLPGVKWMLQGWGGNPKKELVEGLSPEHTIVIDLFGESGSTWRDTGEFYGTPWIWSTVNHFGGKTDMGGQLPVIIKGPHEALASSSGLLCGVGILPEGIFANPVVYDWAMKTAWEEETPDVSSYIDDYLLSRYGRENEFLRRAWTVLAGSIYGDFEIKGEGTFESVLCARPGMNVKNVSTWGPKRYQYNPDDVVEALVLFRKAADEFRESDTYEYDLVDLARQVLANHARSVYDRSMALYRNGDREGFGIMSSEFLGLVSLQDSLVGTRKEFLVGRWLEKARHYGSNAGDRSLSERNARMQISYWGPDTASTSVRDYANKEWSGLLSDYYLPRWEAFYSYLDDLLAGREADEPDYFEMEKAWVDNGKEYPVEPYDYDPLVLVDRLLSKVRPVYKDRTASVDVRVSDLLSRMTLKEKAAQMKHIHFKHYNSADTVDFSRLAESLGGLSRGCFEAFPYTSEQYLNAVCAVQGYMTDSTRLGIPVIPVMEGLHGVVQDGCTVFPQAIAQGATFNPDLVAGMADAIAGEMCAIGAVQALAPDLDIVRDLRWGRVEETFGEDPYLVSCMGNAYVGAMQKRGRIVTPKHFLAHGMPTGGLNLASVKGGERELRDLYLVPFKSVIASQNPLSIMNCYSSYDGEAVTGSKKYMTDLLRKELGFKGYVYSDWGSVHMLQSFHRAVASGEEAAKMAVEAGIDLEAGSSDYDSLERLVEAGRLDMDHIDRAVSNILGAKFASGLFDNPFPDTLDWKSAIHTAASRELARRIADESTVLLTNRNSVLPLDADKLSSLAVIGPNADRVQFGDYSWSADREAGVTPLEGIRNLLAGRKLKLNYARGCDPYSMDRSGFRVAVRAARKSDAAVLFVGSQSAVLARAGEPATSGEGYDLTDLSLPGVQMDLIKEVAAVGKPVIVVLVTGRPFETDGIAGLSDAVLVQWYAGEEAGNSIASILFGLVNPSGKLPVSFPKTAGHLPCYYNHLPTDKGYYNQKGSPDKPGRDYVYSDPYPEFPFGHGLSYTDFVYDSLETESRHLSVTDTIRVRFRITNSGNMRGKAVPQLYVRDKVSTVATPVKQLRAFDKVDIAPGESAVVTFEVPVASLSLHDRDMRETVEAGEFMLFIGESSEDVRLTDTVTVADGTDEYSEYVSGSDETAVRPGLGGYVKVCGTVRNVQAAVLPSVTVSSVSEPSLSAVTGRDGRFELDVRLNDRLVFSLDGYSDVVVDVRRGGETDVDMNPMIN